jgi:prephenate dehydrogenase
MIRRLCVVGLGLMGGSLAMAARRRGAAAEVVGYARRAATRGRALEMGLLDSTFGDPAEAVRDADLIVFCVPVMTIPSLVGACRGAWAPGAVVTDVASTKAWLTREVKRVLGTGPAMFVGSHPMAGSEEAGIEAAREDLYDGAMVVVTTEPEDDAAAVDRVGAFWEAVGARVARRSPDEHDRVVARTSHLPHMAAAALVTRVLGSDDGMNTGPFCAGGFRDSSRIAEGGESMWHDIVRTNRTALLAELAAYGGLLAGLERAVRDEDFETVRQFLARGRELRIRWREEQL